MIINNYNDICSASDKGIYKKIITQQFWISKTFCMAPFGGFRTKLGISNFQLIILIRGATIFPKSFRFLWSLGQLQWDKGNKIKVKQSRVILGCCRMPEMDMLNTKDGHELIYIYMYVNIFVH